MKFEDIKKDCEWLAVNDSGLCGIMDYHFGEEEQCRESVCTDGRLEKTESGKRKD